MLLPIVALKNVAFQSAIRVICTSFYDSEFLHSAYHINLDWITLDPYTYFDLICFDICI